MAFRVVLDANVLFGHASRDLHLWLAEAELYDPVWSNGILDEVASSLVDKGVMPADKATALRGLIEGTFDEASVSPEAVAALTPCMCNEADDRHVLAAAVAAGAGAIVTHNVRHFGSDCLAIYGIELVTPSEFLVDLFHLAPEVVRTHIRSRVAEYLRPPIPWEDFLHNVGRWAPEFARLVR